MNPSPSRQHLQFLDWLKAVGLALIVFGHVAARSGANAVPPIVQKQLGVAFFVFATGFTLARERRSPGRVVYNRLFEIVVVGLAFAMVMSVIGLALEHDLNPSNYLPFFFGANVAVDSLPANPTTWYIGTYLHILVLWAVVLRRVRITLPLIAAGLVIECAARALLIEEAGRYVAYMSVGNWLTVLLLGLWVGNRPSLATPGEGSGPTSFGIAAAATCTLALGWWQVMGWVPWQHTFPFMSLPSTGWAMTFGVSAAVSFVYASYTIAAWSVARTLPASRFIELIARNTVVVVIVHMPVTYLLHWALAPHLGYGPRTMIQFVVCFFGLTFVSEWLMPRLNLKQRRDALAALADRAFGSRRAGSQSLVPRPSSQQS